MKSYPAQEKNILLRGQTSKLSKRNLRVVAAYANLGQMVRQLNMRTAPRLHRSLEPSHWYKIQNCCVAFISLCLVSCGDDPQAKLEQERDSFAGTTQNLGGRSSDDPPTSLNLPAADAEYHFESRYPIRLKSTELQGEATNVELFTARSSIPKIAARIPGLYSALKNEFEEREANINARYLREFKDRLLNRSSDEEISGWKARNLSQMGQRIFDDNVIVTVKISTLYGLTDRVVNEDFRYWNLRKSTGEFQPVSDFIHEGFNNEKLRTLLVEKIHSSTSASDITKSGIARSLIEVGNLDDRYYFRLSKEDGLASGLVFHFRHDEFGGSSPDYFEASISREELKPQLTKLGLLFFFEKM